MGPNPLNDLDLPLLAVSVVVPAKSYWHVRLCDTLRPCASHTDLTPRLRFNFIGPLAGLAPL